MSQVAPYIPDQFAILVDRVNTKVLATIQENQKLITGRSTSDITKVSYDHGHPREIIENLKKKAESTGPLMFERLPLVALFEDITITDSRIIGCWANVRLNLVIINSTLPEYVADDRYAKNFKPILDVIYEELLNQIDLSAWYHVQDKGLIRHKMIKRLFWGKQGLYGNNVANMFNDYIDAIEISDLDLDVYYDDECQV